MRFEKTTFATSDGHLLAGRIDLPVTGDPVACAVYAHCFTCTKNLSAVGRITETLARRGIATLRFDFTGVGESQGELADTTFDSRVADLVAAARHLEERFRAPEVLIGHSLGGTVALAAGSVIDSVQAVATIAAPGSPDHVTRHIDRDLDEIRKAGGTEVMIGGRPFTIDERLLEDFASVHLDERIRRLGRPLLVLHSPIDNVVGIENATEIFRHARHPKSFVSLDTADHLISDDDDARYAAEVIASWASRYIGGDLTLQSQPDFVVEAPESVTVVRTEVGFRTEILSNGFPLVADEPVAVGGTNTGPTPYDYLLTALGSCTAMTLRMYADRKDWPLESVTVRLTHRKVHARDCAECESDEGIIDRITRDIDLRGPLDDEQRGRLLDIADRCPVHKTLHGEVVVISDSGSRSGAGSAQGS